MTQVVGRELGAAGPARRDLPRTVSCGRAVGRLLGTVADAVRRALVTSELRRLDDRLLRDVGLYRVKVAGRRSTDTRIGP